CNMTMMMPMMMMSGYAMTSVSVMESSHRMSDRPHYMRSRRMNRRGHWGWDGRARRWTSLVIHHRRRRFRRRAMEKAGNRFGDPRQEPLGELRQHLRRHRSQRGQQRKHADRIAQTVIDDLACDSLRRIAVSLWILSPLWFVMLTVLPQV